VEAANWRNRSEIPDVCVVVHVYYTDLLEKLLGEISKIDFEFDLLITNSSDSVFDADYVKSVIDCGQVKSILILNTINRGRDILPLIHCVNAGLLDPYHYIFKFHTKKSQWASNRNDVVGGQGGDAWFNSFTEGLIGEGTNSRFVLQMLREDPDLGLVTADGSLFGSGYWSTNLKRCEELAQRIEIEIKPELLFFAAGSMYACKGLLVQGLRSLCLSEIDFEDETGQIDGTTAHAIERLMGFLAHEANYKQATTQSLENEKKTLAKSERTKPKFVAYYLPQFHADAINDLHWGKNFTEWQNVTRSIPQFINHYQPLLPVDIGFYDLSSDHVTVQQEQLAKEYGIDAFMYYYYDFGGETALQVPIINRLKRTHGLPFSILWVNESWSRNWDGLNNNVIIDQKYPENWEKNLIESLAIFFEHSDYLRDSYGRPILSIYRPQSIPDVTKSLTRMREAARNSGIGELKILFTETANSFSEGISRDLNLISDGINAFPPHGIKWNVQERTTLKMNPAFSGEIFSYSSPDKFSPDKSTKKDYHPGVLTRFDNTPRRLSDASIVYGSNPYSFRAYLRRTLDDYAKTFHEDSLMFINAWNEWAEGAVLEPSNRFGYSYLLAIREVKNKYIA
jgi:lipopolysaccharide biosynthesis protein